MFLILIFYHHKQGCESINCTLKVWSAFFLWHFRNFDTFNQGKPEKLEILANLSKAFWKKLKRQKDVFIEKLNQEMIFKRKSLKNSNSISVLTFLIQQCQIKNFITSKSFSRIRKTIEFSVGVFSSFCSSFYFWKKSVFLRKLWHKKKRKRFEMQRLRLKFKMIWERHLDMLEFLVEFQKLKFQDFH